MASTMVADRATEPASLLGIPPELRNQIYHYVAHDAGHVFIYQGTLIPHALTRACRQTRREFLPVFQATTGMKLDMIRAVVYNFEFRSLEHQLLRLHLHGDLPSGSWRTHRPDPSAEKIKRALKVVIVANDAKEMCRREKAVTTSHSHLWDGLLGRFRCEYDCEYEIRADFDALGAQGIAGLRRKLLELRQPSDNTSLHLPPSSSSDPLEQGPARLLKTPISRARFEMGQAA